MGHIRMGSEKRYYIASLICDYLIRKHITRVRVSARDIARFHHLQGESCRSISALLNFLYSNQIRKPGFGFYIMGTQAFSKSEYPHRFTIQLIDGAKGLL